MYASYGRIFKGGHVVGIIEGFDKQAVLAAGPIVKYTPTLCTF